MRFMAVFFAAFAATLEPALAALHPGDRVTIVVYEHPELSVDATIASDGAISVPLLGRVRAEGTEPNVLAARIAARLDKYVVEPAVEVRIIDGEQYAFITGIAGSTVTLRPGLPLTTALGETKLDPSADLARVAVVRDGRSLGTFDVDALRASGEPGPTLEAGDVIQVPAKPVVVVVNGAVKQTGKFYLTPDEPLADALQQATPGEDANDEKIILERGGQMQVTTLGGPILAKPGQTGDRVTVPQSQQIEVVGFVEHPGVVALKTDNSLISALFFAGGPGKDGDLRRVSIVHRDGTKTQYDLRGLQKGDLSQNPVVSEGDIVYVPEQHGFDFRILFDVLLFGTRFIRFR